MTETQKLLAEYLKSGSEAAFHELVTRYINLVYGTALRLVGGNAPAAEDVTQTVFVHLARKAHGLSNETALGGWLHRDTCHVAATLMRGERRRQNREREAVEMNPLQDHSASNLAQVTPVLDEAINQLGAEDRVAIVLRFYEQRNLRAVGEALGSSENAAQKRVTRALEELRALLQQRGVALSAAALGTALATEAATAAPVGLAVSVAGGALVAAGTGTTFTLLKIITMTKLKIGIVSAIVAACVATTLVMQHQAQAKLREQDETLRQQGEQLAQLKLENEGRANQPSRAGSNNLDDLMRLRGEVESLRQQTNDMARLQAENQRLKGRDARKQEVPKMTLLAMEDTREQAIAKMNYSRNWLLAFMMSADKNQGQFPTNFEQAAAFLPDQAKVETNLFSDQFEIVYQGGLNKLTNAPNVIMLREKQAWQTPDGKWAKIYGFADGHSEMHAKVDDDFDTYEKAHIVSSAPPGQ
ncbi:MAG: polymerase, sigma-24 subunit, subfamily [Pedosphaera sp.]|nr:polymerase, sigma-24 subunit, subfamily [Pedosphaera sp.]